MDNGLIATGLAVVVLGGAAVGVRMLRASRERRQLLALVNRKCEKCGHFVQSERSRHNNQLEGVMGRTRVPVGRGAVKLVPQTFNLCDRCAQQR